MSMITERKLQIYAKYSGDIDGWVRTGKGGEVREITDQEWRDIDSILQRMDVVKRGEASADFEEETRRLATGLAENAQVLDALWHLA
jgi:hypothetical protein